MTTQSEIAKWFETLPEDLKRRITESVYAPDDSDLYTNPDEIKNRAIESDAAREVYDMETDGGGTAPLQPIDVAPEGNLMGMDGAPEGSGIPLDIPSGLNPNIPPGGDPNVSPGGDPNIPLEAPPNTLRMQAGTPMNTPQMQGANMTPEEDERRRMIAQLTGGRGFGRVG